MLISGLSGNVDHSQRSFGAPTAACGDRFAPQDLKSVEESLKMARQMAELQQLLGKSSTDWNERVARMEQNLKLAAEPPRQFSARTHQEVASFLAGTGPLPTDLTPDDHEKLKTFSSLVQRGVMFVEPLGLAGKTTMYGNGKDQVAVERPDFPVPVMPPECAFLRLIAYRFHAPENQVQYASLKDNVLTMATLRPGYLKGLDFFLREASQGQEFYRPAKKGGYEKAETAWDFLETYAEDPESALVLRKSERVDFARATAALASPDADGYLYVPFRDAGKPDEPTSSPTPGIQERDGQVVVGGVLLRRRRGA